MSDAPTPSPRRSLVVRVLDRLEVAGNWLPHPFWLFVGLVLTVAALSHLLAVLGVERMVPGGEEGERIVVRSLLSKEGLNWLVLDGIRNFAHFEPLGIVLVMLMGVAVAEGAGLVHVGMRTLALAVPRGLVTPVLFALAACGNIGSDAGIVVVPPLAAAIFVQLGRSPIAGLLVGYVGATAGFTANVLPAGTDVIAMTLTNEASGSNPPIGVLANWYFMALSVPFLALLGTFVTHRVVEPRLGVSASPTTPDLEPPTRAERRGLWAAMLAVAALAALWSLTVVPEGGWLRSEEPGEFWRSPFFKGFVPVLFTLFVAGGVAYGRVAGTLTKPGQVIEWMTGSVKRMAPYVVLVLVIAQFIAAFKWTGLDRLIAVEGAQALRSLGFEQAPLAFFVAFVLVVACANLFVGSASAKWAVFAPIVVPMFLGLGYHPAFTQLLYRIGDSITNCVSPLYPFFPLLVGWIAEHDPDKAKVGTVLSYLVPYAAVLLVGWIVMMAVWYATGLPVGPDAPILLVR